MASAKTRTCGEGCRFASLQTPLFCNHKNRGLKSPRLFIFPSSRRIFSHNSLLNAHRSTLKGVCQDAKPVRANSRGFSNPWNNDMKKKWRLQRRGRTVRVADSRLYRRHYYVVTKNRGLKSPRLFISTSSRRIFSHNSLLITHFSTLIAQRRLQRREARKGE